MAKHRARFEAGDFELLQEAVSIHPDLTITAQAAKLVRQQDLQYPIATYEGLRPLFSGQSEKIVIGTRVFTFAELEKFMPKVFFPLESERDLMQKVFMTLAIGAASHNEENRGSVPANWPSLS